VEVGIRSKLICSHERVKSRFGWVGVKPDANTFRVHELHVSFEALVKVVHTEEDLGLDI
jgi:hypothetical protein